MNDDDRPDLLFIESGLAEDIDGTYVEGLRLTDS